MQVLPTQQRSRHTLAPFPSLLGRGRGGGVWPTSLPEGGCIWRLANFLSPTPFPLPASLCTHTRTAPHLRFTSPEALARPIRTVGRCCKRGNLKSRWRGRKGRGFAYPAPSNPTPRGYQRQAGAAGGSESVLLCVQWCSVVSASKCAPPAMAALPALIPRRRGPAGPSRTLCVEYRPPVSPATGARRRAPVPACQPCVDAVRSSAAQSVSAAPWRRPVIPTDLPRACRRHDSGDVVDHEQDLP